MEHVGPGSYAKSTETGPAVQKRFGGALAAAFGTIDSRKLDTTCPDNIPNPGPGAYRAKHDREFTNLTHQEIRKLKQQAVFASGNPRKDGSLGDPTFPAPGDYNVQDYNSVSKKFLTGGAPNNILSLQKAEEKKLFDMMFPFLVQNRFIEPKEHQESMNLGPGTYAPDEMKQSTAGIKLKLGRKH